MSKRIQADVVSITLIIQSQHQKQVCYRLRRNTPLKKLMGAYCAAAFLEYKTVVFLHDGHRVNPTDTPEKLGLEDNDEIDVMVHFDGGSSGDQSSM